MRDQELLEQISKKLNAFLALIFTKDVASLTTADRVKLLMRFDLSNKDIADILGTTKGTIEVTKSRISKIK